MTVGSTSALINVKFIDGRIMFNKTSDQTAPPATPSNTRSVFSSDLKITGEISSVGDIEMLGDIDGNITARSLSVGAEGRMNGTITAETVEVQIGRASCRERV